MEMEMEKGRSKLVRNAQKLVEKAMAGRDASHDASHAFRVRDLALSLASEEDLGSDQTSKSDSLEIVKFLLFSFEFFTPIQGIHAVVVL
jgi:hypothetical protein